MTTMALLLGDENRVTRVRRWSRRLETAGPHAYPSELKVTLPVREGFKLLEGGHPQ